MLPLSGATSPVTQASRRSRLHRMKHFGVKCMNQEHVCHNITTRDPPPRQMKHTLHTRHFHNVQSLLANTEKDALMAIHTATVAKAKRAMRDNTVLGDYPPPISDEEAIL